MKQRQRKKLVRYRPIITFKVSKELADILFKNKAQAEIESFVSMTLRKKVKQEKRKK